MQKLRGRFKEIRYRLRVGCFKNLNFQAVHLIDNKSELTLISGVGLHIGPSGFYAHTWSSISLASTACVDNVWATYNRQCMGNVWATYNRQCMGNVWIMYNRQCMGNVWAMYGLHV